jgi:hypothetical protein
VEPTAMVAVQIAEEILDSIEEKRPVDTREFSGWVTPAKVSEWRDLVPGLRAK